MKNLFINIISYFSIFTESEIEEIKKLKLRDVLLQATGIEDSDLQENIFFWKEGIPF